MKSDKKPFTSDERISKTEKILLQWNSDSYSSLNMDWNELFLDLIKFKQQWGHFDFPQKYAKNPKLEVWVSQQSSQYRLLKVGKKSSISDEKISKLGKLGLQWNY